MASVTRSFLLQSNQSLKYFVVRRMSPAPPPTDVFTSNTEKKTSSWSTHLRDGAPVLWNPEQCLLVGIAYWIVEVRRDGELQP